MPFVSALLVVELQSLLFFEIIVTDDECCLRELVVAVVLAAIDMFVRDKCLQ